MEQQAVQNMRSSRYSAQQCLPKPDLECNVSKIVVENTNEGFCLLHCLSQTSQGSQYRLWALPRKLIV